MWMCGSYLRLFLLTSLALVALSAFGESSDTPAFWGKLPNPGHNNLWYEKNSSETVFVFVHGIFSDSRSCWLYVDQNAARNQYWPELVRNDDRFLHASIYLGGYYTALDAGPYDAVQAAKELRDAMKRDGVFDRKQIIFIAHSTGGIVVRYLLYHNQELFRSKSVGLALYASPSIGSYGANVLSWLSESYNQQLGAQLQVGSPFLTELDHNFRDMLYNPNSNPQNVRIIGAEAVENHFIIHRRFLPDKVLLVPEDSASRYFGSPTYLRNTDHFSTVKPDQLDHPAHQFLVTFFQKYTQDTSVSEASNNNPADGRVQTISELKIGMRRSYIESKLGLPAFEEKIGEFACVEYAFSLGDLRIVYRPNNALFFYRVLAKDLNFHPVLFGVYQPDPSRDCLGCSAFADLLESPEPVYFNFSAHNWLYVERRDLPYSWHATVFFFYDGRGADYADSGDIAGLDFPGSDDDLRRLPDSQRGRYLSYRQRKKPNGFAVLEDFSDNAVEKIILGAGLDHGGDDDRCGD